MALDALVIGTAPHAAETVQGLTLVERGRRVCAKIGARRICVVEHAADLAGLAAWDAERCGAGLVVVNAGDQVVHKPLLEPLLAGHGARRIAVGPDDAPAGALYADGDEATAIVQQLAAGASVEDVSATWRDAERVRHGEIAVHAARTDAERGAAGRMLQRLNIKKEDNPVTKHVYRPLSKPLTQLLVRTPLTPNQISFAVGVLGVVGCWLTAQPGQAMLIWGAALIFFAGVLDGCDGEIARLKLVYSPLGAWIDTVVDEITTTGYFIGIALHAYRHNPEAWIGHSIWIGTLAYVVTIYAIYYYCIVVAKVGGSQFYEGELEIAEGPGGIGLRVKKRSAKIQSKLLREVGAWLMYVKTRDFINLAALGLALLDAYWVIYLGMLVGGVITAVIVIRDHIKLRFQLGEVARRGGSPQLV